MRSFTICLLVTFLFVRCNRMFTPEKLLDPFEDITLIINDQDLNTINKLTIYRYSKQYIDFVDWLNINKNG
jgi:hypothetical protein